MSGAEVRAGVLPDLTLGDVVATRSIVAVFDIPEGGAEITYRAPKGTRFAFLFLGAAPVDEPRDPEAVLKALGWTPPTEPLTIGVGEEVDLADYLAYAQQENERCAADWRENQAKDPEHWPEKMTLGEWDEQFRVFFGAEMTRAEAQALGAQAADADWEMGDLDPDPWPDDCPSIQTDLEIEDWREGYLARADVLKDQI